MCAGVTRPRGLGSAEAATAAAAEARERGGGATRALKPDHHEHQAGHLQVSAQGLGVTDPFAFPSAPQPPAPTPGLLMRRSPATRETEAQRIPEKLLSCSRCGFSGRSSGCGGSPAPGVCVAVCRGRDPRPG